VDLLISHFNYFISISLMMIGLYAMMGKMNLVKKLVGMNIFQWSIILFFVSTGAKHGATIPILEASHGHHGAEVIVQASHYVNPLPHVLMLTAIVVGVATTGVALALLLRIYRTYGTLEEDEILKKMR
jgi:multicomponent Na+:H+ antiporter subunit C